MQESVYSTHTSAITTTHNVNGNLATHTNITLISNEPIIASTSITPTNPSVAMPTTTRSGVGGMSKQSVRASVSSSNVAVAGPTQNKVLIKARSDEEYRAPPLPPRKAGDKQQRSHVSSASNSNATSMLNLSTSSSSNPISSSRSTENITMLNDLEVPKTMAPPVPKHRTPAPTIDTLAHDLHTTYVTPSTYNEEDYEVEAIIVGPAETITGIIDTRPLEARKPIHANNSTTTTNNTVTHNIENAEKNNVYHVKTATSTGCRPQSVVGTTTTTTTTNSTNITTTTTPSVNEEKSQINVTSSPARNRKPPAELPPLLPPSTTAPPVPIPCSVSTSAPLPVAGASTSSVAGNISTAAAAGTVSQQKSATSQSTKGGGGGSSQPQRPTSTPPQSHFVYENMTINQAKDCNNVPYENINLEYIARLMNEGYSKEHVITALGISRNNIEVAYDMLHVFVKKGGGRDG